MAVKVLKAAAAAAINTRVVGLACKNHEGCADWYGAARGRYLRRSLPKSKTVAQTLKQQNDLNDK